MFDPVIRSLLDTDLYKYTMLQAFLHSFPQNQAVYRFVCRNRPDYPLSELVDDVRAQAEHLCSLRFTEQELEYLSTKRFFKSDFIDFLRIFRLQQRYLEVDAHGEELVIRAVGPQLHVMAFEVFMLSIVNELYFRRFHSPAVLAEGRARLAAKIAQLRESGAALGKGARENSNTEKSENPQHPFEFFDFGTRRRFSRDWHDEVVATLVRELPECFRGTSNLFLAKKYGLAAIGTMAHEYLQTYQAVGVQLKNFQKAALEGWVHEYRGDLGIALTDVVGMDAFLADFDLYFAKLFDGLRHDSGDPIEWGEKALKHYQQLRIDAHCKRLVFSDGLDIPKALAIHRHFANRVQCGFGIGTNLTNDLGIPALNIVMKLTECNGQPVAKISDSPGKALSTDETFLAYLRQVFKRP